MRLSLRESRIRGGWECREAGIWVRFGRDDKGEGEASMESGCWTEGVFITLGGPEAHER